MKQCKRKRFFETCNSEGLMAFDFVRQALTASMDGGSQAALQGMMQHAEEVRLKPTREE